VTLYEDTHFQGRHKVFSSAHALDIGYVGDDFNDLTSSIRVVQASGLNLDATFYSREETRCHPPATEIHGLTLQEVQSGQQSPQCGSPSVARLQCAVDPNVIPLKTEFTLRLWDGSEVPATALDTGTAIIGNRIDIFVDTNEEAINLGHQSVVALL
jgi:3D (Asp-Asp-Asp) domain-containing protein